MYKPALIFIFLLISLSLRSQEEQNRPYRGTLSGQWRTFYMTTQNKGDLKDYYAMATGGHIRYQYRFSDRWRIGAAFYTSANLQIQDLTLADRTTGKTSRYEVGLFDVTDIEDPFIWLVGEFYLGYRSNHHEIQLGRMKVNTPFLNAQDGRMIPTLVEGVWYTYSPGDHTHLQLGLIGRIAPRSTARFYNIGESIGLYPVGRDVVGDPSGYLENVNSDLIAVASADFDLGEKMTLNVWDLYVDNVFNSFYVRSGYDLSDRWKAEVEWLHQNRVNNGGNAIDSLTYFSNKFSDVIGGRVTYKMKRSSLSLAYDRITGAGRFLFPREWGREFLFSFQKRERSEGTAGNHALVAYFHTNTYFSKLRTRMKAFWSAGQNWKDSTTDPALNKYAFSSYAHFNADLFFEFDKLKGFRPELLVTYKVANGDYPDNPNFIINKADMWNINLVLNYNF
ncbi:OprD family outer membrane porin [Robertkochia sediminum]|uniref:OprD family outer membrane porin n=1 Tax=Robertkochia sediminum TaxID=2785326 RepID=UPI0019321ED0|nr:OprD family outer membrane porin [Robertkochia sediminum]MBL7471536.1 outer membrane porin, OprD family [Robertkochia sediminum]